MQRIDDKDPATKARIEEKAARAKRNMEDSFRAWFRASNIFLPEFILARLVEIVVQNMEHSFNAGFDEGKVWLAEQMLERMEHERTSHEDQTGDADWLSSKRKH